MDGGLDMESAGSDHRCIEWFPLNLGQQCLGLRVKAASASVDVDCRHK